MYRVLWETDDCVDSFESTSFGQAKQDALDLLIEWEVQEMSDWGLYHPTQEQIDRWDYMIESCFVSVIECEPGDFEIYQEVWEPDDEDLDRIGWKYYEELEPELRKFREMNMNGV